LERRRSASKLGGIFKSHEDAQAKTTIKEALDAITKGCGPSSEKYMTMFFSSKKKKSETMVAYGLKLQGNLKKGMPEANPATLLVQLKMQLNNQSPEKIRVLINTNNKQSWAELMETIDRVYPVESGEDEDIIEKEAKVDSNMANAGVQNGRGRFSQQ
jgi:hypothetical protein